MSAESDEARRAALLAELDSTIRKRDAKRYVHREIIGQVVSFSLLMVAGFCCGMGLLVYFSNIVR